MKNCWKKVICAALVLTSGLLIAADGEEESRPRRRQGNSRQNWREDGKSRQGRRPQGGGFGGMMLMRLNKEAEVEAKFKEEYTAAVKQMIEAEKKMAELAKKAKVELPADMNMTLRQLKLKYPTEFAAIQKKMQSRETMREAMSELAKLAEKENLRLPMFGMRPPRNGEGNGERPPEPPRMRENQQSLIRKIKKLYPQEWEEIQKLQHEGKRDEAREKIRELMRKVNASQTEKPQQK